MPKIGAGRRVLLLCAGLAIALTGVQVHFSKLTPSQQEISLAIAQPAERPARGGSTRQPRISEHG